MHLLGDHLTGQLRYIEFGLQCVMFYLHSNINAIHISCAVLLTSPGGHFSEVSHFFTDAHLLSSDADTIVLLCRFMRDASACEQTVVSDL